jgi:hypothetical protein
MVPLPAPEPAEAVHPEVAEREVVTHRIAGVERPKRSRDVGGHVPPGAAIPRQAEAPGDADHVGVERNDEARGGNALPRPEIHTVASHHPPEKEVQPLAGAPVRRPREEVRDTGPAAPVPDRG